jgi:prepilin-type N-terminal cleavage/methylation domain-containing protein
MEMRTDSASTTAEREENKKRGFTLTEIAIVLGIIGLILGAIWVAAAAVYTNMRVARSSQELLSITQAVRSLYATSTVTGVAASTPMTANLIPAGVFPNDSLTAGTSGGPPANAPWNGGFITVYSDTITNAGDAFTVQFEGVPPQGCINLLVSATGTGRDPGMVSAGGNPLAAQPAGAYAGLAAADLYSAGTNQTAFTSATPGVSVTTAATDCNGGAAKPFATVNFTFRLRV